MNRIFTAVICILLLNLSCRKQVKSEVEVYNNNFQGGNLSGFTNGIISQYNSNAVLGQYHNQNVSLKIADLPKHDIVTITFDLYIHDGWDGNKPSPLGPDLWEMQVDGDTYINASFSNDTCLPGNFCSPQSYPLNYPNNYSNPKKGAFKTDLPGFCSVVSNPDSTSLYKIAKTFKHSNNTLIMQYAGKLMLPSSLAPECSESWSVDNIIIKAITL
ncbi:hypothetical protein [Mucilaginibacter antarcticus]|uniref:Uncharacterized protein n=1 Tax=Mucilaginibacter antarcticus TaxID=1855725 RepID=A0ABW5XPI2_9SPHI